MKDAYYYKHPFIISINTMDPHRRNLYFKTHHKSSTRIPRQWAISVQQYYLISTTKMTVKYASLDIARPKHQLITKKLLF